MRVSPRRSQPAISKLGLPRTQEWERIFRASRAFFILILFGGTTVNRKLIRTTLADVKARRDAGQQRDRANGNPPRSGGFPQPRPAQQPTAIQVRKRQPPPFETHAEIYYYKKQIDAHTPMVLVLQDGEEIEGTIEWYDRGALKINRKSAPNLLVLKRNIKYMYKVEDRVGQPARVEDSEPQATEF